MGLKSPPLRVRLLSFLIVLLALTGSAQAAIQFDVFLGYDGTVPEASWFPVVCEIKNDGPTFTGTIEIKSGAFNRGQNRQVVVELPTGTLKRVVIPVFSTARYQSSWDLVLLDERGKVRAEQPGVKPRKQVAVQTVIMGALPRSINGLPVLREILPKNDLLIHPMVARLQSAMLPDNPLVFNGMSCLYLNSEKALELKDPQVTALLDWLHAGGNLIVAVEQVGDVNGTPWLQKLLPIDLAGMSKVSSHAGLQQWVKDGKFAGGKSMSSNPFGNLSGDLAFEGAELQVAEGRLRQAQVLAREGDKPLMIQSPVGRGQLTVLLFSPEREPVKSWKNLSSFWSKLAEVPPDLYLNENASMHGGFSVDGVFGAMIDSKQVRKLPVQWLLLLLLVYLVVIGPLDQYWLKKIKRPMLTWITFPCYVVLFSLLIYFIGYKLRAGESEWNELHVVDVFPSTKGAAELRGWTYASIYSPVNSNYKLEAVNNYSAFRGEFQSSFGNGQETEKADVLQTGDNFKAEIFVPVWTSLLYVCDWWQSADRPMDVTVTPEKGGGWTVVVNNHLDRPLANLKLIIAGRIIDLGELEAGKTRQLTVQDNQGVALGEFVRRTSQGFVDAARSRQQAFGGNTSGRITEVQDSCLALSFLSEGEKEQKNFELLEPPGLDLAPAMNHGQAIVVGWSANFSPVKGMNLFSPRRSQKDTMWRLSVPLGSSVP